MLFAAISKARVLCDCIAASFVSVQLSCMETLGKYVGRICEEVNDRPVWFVKRRINLAREADHSPIATQR